LAWSSGNVSACRVNGREIESRHGLGRWVFNATMRLYFVIDRCSTYIYIYM
jgi:hypothetical protein